MTGVDKSLDLHYDVGGVPACGSANIRPWQLKTRLEAVSCRSCKRTRAYKSAKERL
jgi:hypothetical protein